MEPLFHGGDLAIIRETRGKLQIGEVALYRSDLTNQTVLHRVVATDGDRYVFKGDNNNWIDTYHPSDADIVGKLWFHVENAGRAFEWLRDPLHGALFGGVVTAVTVGGVVGEASGQARGKTKRRSHALMGGLADLPLFAFGPKGQSLLGLLLVLLVASVAAGVFAYRAPLTRTTTTQLKYQSQGEFSYTAPVSGAATSVYGGSALWTGDPIYINLIPSVFERFGFTFLSPEPHNVAGTIRLTVVVGDINGWRRSIDLAPPTPFEGDTATVVTKVDLVPLMDLLQGIEQSTGNVPRYYTAAIVADTEVHGSVGGLPFSQDFEPSFVFRMLPPNQVYVETPETRLLNNMPELPVASGGVVPADPFHSSKAAAVVKAIPSDNTFSIWRFKLPVRQIRQGSIIGGEIGLVGSLVFLFLVMLATRRSESRRIYARHGKELVRVNDFQLAANAHVVHVASFEEMLFLADQCLRPILWNDRGGPDVYWVEEGGTVYWYQLPEEASDAGP